MAQVDFTISGFDPTLSFGQVGSFFTGSIILATGDTDTAVPASAPIDSVVLNATTMFSVGSDTPYTKDSGNEPVSGLRYVSFRNTTNINQYPTAGRSFDIWSTTIATLVANFQTWNAIVNNSSDGIGPGNFRLDIDNLNKRSVIYDYANRYALANIEGRSNPGIPAVIQLSYTA